MDDYSGHQATELDFHANMAVAGFDCTVIARSGCFANVTPFHKDIPAMEMVEIGDAMVAYDHPILLRTYLLVMRNALLIKSMDHGLIPSFLIQEAGLLLDKTTKHQLEHPTIDKHAIVDPVTGMRIHLSLNGIFSYFRTRCLTSEEINNWDNYRIVFITPDGDAWDPNAEHYAEQEAAMLNSEGMIIEREERPPKHIFTEVDIGMLYIKPATWKEFNDTVDKVMAEDDDPFLGCPLTDDEEVKLNQDGICAQLSSIDVSHEPLLFLAAIKERAHMSHVLMAMGSVSIDDSACDLFEANLSSMLATAFATVAAVWAGKQKGLALSIYLKCGAYHMKMQPAPYRLPHNAYTTMQTRHCPATLVQMTQP
jgi:hypothetical protein